MNRDEVAAIYGIDPKLLGDPPYENATSYWNARAEEWMSNLNALLDSLPQFRGLTLESKDILDDRCL